MNELELLAELQSHDVDAWRCERTRVYAHAMLQRSDLRYRMLNIVEPALACGASAALLVWAFSTVIEVIS